MDAMPVLLVEDEPSLAETMRRGLSEHGYAVDVARTGERGLELATNRAYGGILLDVMLPGIHGDEVLRELRARQVRTPVIILTAGDGEHDQAWAIGLGADGFLGKPFSFVVLLERLAALVRGSGGADPSPAPPGAPRAGQVT